MGAVETLKKISFQNLEQFTEEINRNFAIVENSPLYKGIPGKGGKGGIEGLRGIRGSQFLFVELTKFNLQFPGEFMNASRITLEAINLKMEVFEDKQKLMVALGAEEFVSNDIIVLTNSIMLKYDNSSDRFIDTRLAFNEQSNLASSIEVKIEDYVRNYIDNSPELNAKNIFESFETYAKNYTDTNNTQITTAQTESSVFVPYYPGVTNTSGVKLNDHKYFGFGDSEFPKINRGTIVFGSLRRYIELLMATTSTAQDETFTSDYAPGNNNIPAAIFMQDTDNTGILIGKKSDLNLKRYGSIYKDVEGNLVIKSDSGVLSHEFSKLLINQVSMSYAKDVYFGSKLNIGGNLEAGGNINNPFIRTGGYVGATPANIDEIEIGGKKSDNGSGATTTHIAATQKFTHFASKVFVTDATGTVRKDYSIETATNINNVTNDSKKLITSNLIVQLRNMVTGVEDATGNFYTQIQFTNGDIPSLKLSQNLEVAGTADTKGALLLGTHNLIQSANNSHQLDLGSVATTALLNLRSMNVRLGNFSNNVLVTDSAGNVLKTHTLNADAGTVGTSIPEASTSSEDLITGKNTATTSILTGNQYAWMITLFNNIKTRFKNTFNKTETDARYLQKTDNLNSLSNKDTALTNLDGTTLGKNIFRGANPTVQGFIMINTNGTISYRSNVQVRSDIGAAAASHTHNASDVNAGVLADARIPSLNASKINGGTFILDRMPRSTSGFLRANGTSANPTYEMLRANDIPSLDATKINSGVFHIDRMARGSGGFLRAIGTGVSPIYATLTANDIPSLDASKITSGTLGTDRIPSLDASKIGSGLLNIHRMPRAASGFLRANGTDTSPSYANLSANDIPNLSTDKLTSGVLSTARGGTGDSNTNGFLRTRNIVGTDFNEQLANGIYDMRDSNISNHPFVLGPHGRMLSIGDDLTGQSQMLFHDNGGVSVRSRDYNNVWSIWRRLYDNDYHPDVYSQEWLDNKFLTYLSKTNSTKYIPVSPYQPATKNYADNPRRSKILQYSVTNSYTNAIHLGSILVNAYRSTEMSYDTIVIKQPYTTHDISVTLPSTDNLQEVFGYMDWKKLTIIVDPKSFKTFKFGTVFTDNNGDAISLGMEKSDIMEIANIPYDSAYRWFLMNLRR